MNRRRRLLKRAMVTLIFVTVLYHAVVFLFSHFYLRGRIVAALESRLGGQASLRFAWTDLWSHFGLRGLNLEHGATVSIQLARLDLTRNSRFFSPDRANSGWVLRGSHGHLNLEELLPRLMGLDEGAASERFRLPVTAMLRDIRLVLPPYDHRPLIFPHASLDWVQNEGRFRGELRTARLFSQEFPARIRIDGDYAGGSGEIVAGPGPLSLRPSAGLPASVSGEVRLDGLFVWALSDGRPHLTDWAGNGRLENTSLQLGSFHFDSLSGEVRASRSGNIIARLGNDNSRLEADILAGPDFAETVSVRLAFAGRHRILPDLDLRGHFDGRHFACDELRIRAGEGEARVSGLFDTGDGTYATRLKARNVDLQIILPLLRRYLPLEIRRGLLQEMDLELRGSALQPPCPTGQVKLRQLEAAGLEIAEADLNLALQDRTVKLEKTRIRLQSGEECQLSGQLCLDGSGETILDVRHLDVPAPTLARILPGMSGSVRVDGSLRIQGRNLRFQGEFQGKNLQVGGFPLFSRAEISFRGRLHKGKLQLDELQMRQNDETLTVIPQGDDFLLSGTLAGAPLSRWLEEQLPGRALHVDQVEFRLRTHRQGWPEGRVQFRALGGRERQIPWKIAQGVLNFHRDRVRAEAIRLETVGGSLNGDLEYRLAATELVFALKGDLPGGGELLRRFLPDLESHGVSAELDLTGRVRLQDGQIDDLDGQVELKAGRIKAPFLADALEELHCRLMARGRQLKVREGRFQVGGMIWNIQGGWDLTAGFPGRLDMTAACDEAAWKVPKLVDVKGSARFLVGGTAVAPQVRGEVEIKEGILTLPREMSETPAISADEIEVDIGLTASHRFWVRHDFLNAELSGTVRMVSRDGRLGLAGSFQVVRGNFAFNGREFRIEEGRIHFPASLKLSPLLQVKAEARIGQYQVKVETSGAIDQLAVNLTSSPFLRQEEILALITTGHPKNATAGGDTGRVGGQLLLDYQKNQVFGGVRRSIQDTLKLDDLNFDTGLSDESGRKEQNLRVGKYLGDKLYVTYTLKKSEETEKVKRMEFDYRLDKKTNFTIEDSSDRGTTFGIRVKRDF